MSAKWVVAKFGGTSVSTRTNWNNIARAISQHLNNNYKVLVVCSAASGISNTLDAAIQAALKNQHSPLMESIENTHQQLCQALELDYTAILKNDIDQLNQLFTGIALTNDVSPKLQARIMGFGELLLTKMGKQFLQNHHINITWLDAREILQSHNYSPSLANNYLDAHCSTSRDEMLTQQLNSLQSNAFITQGFIAANQNKEPVILGRGGSDTSAAYFAAKLNADVCEIWTDVLGIYTANPNQIPEARLLHYLNYDEAQELASMGAKVLHPKCIDPLKQHNIPLHIKQTAYPERAGTIISNQASDQHLQIKSVITKHNVFLISIETIRMWQQVGFLADVFAIFKKHALSIDLISTSESTVTLSIDNGRANEPNESIHAVMQELRQNATVNLIGPCASISLVGNQIRTNLHKLGSIFSLFESEKIHLLSQSANDLNLTIVVDSEQADKLTQRIHHLIIEQHPKRHHLGRSWAEECGHTLPVIHQWWQDCAPELLTLMDDHKASSLYVYNTDCITQAASRLKSLKSVDRLFYAMKANNHPTLLKTIHEAGINFECVSSNEIKRVLELFPSIDKQRILFTPNFARHDEYTFAFNNHAYVTIDNLYPLQHWPELFKNKQIILRIDPGYGAGHHKFVRTGGVESKFGIAIEDVPTIKALAKKHAIEIIGLHIHSGSGILQADIWQKSAAVLVELTKQFDTVRLINLGGGLGVVEKPGQNPLDIAKLDESLRVIKLNHPRLEIWMEPGRYFVAESGVLLSRVTQIKQKHDMHFVGIDTGMNSLLRPALYGAYHEIVNLTRLHDPKTQVVNIVGPICESGDTLGYSRLFPESKEGDVILIANTGAYGHAMSSHYNLREPAQEVCVDF